MKRKRSVVAEDVGTIEDMPISIPGVAIACSKSQEGKSHWIRYIFHENRDKIDYAIAISNTCMDEENLPFIPDRFKFTTWPGEKTKAAPRGKTKHAIMNMLAEQQKIPKDCRPVVALVIEDEFESLRDPLIQAIATRPFHYNVFLVIATNWVNKLVPTIREAAWQVVLF